MFFDVILFSSGIAKEMLKAARQLAASANVPAIAGIMTTSRGQVIAESLGYVKYNEIYYIRYLINDQVFDYYIILSSL